tara:strand:+ start:480 stop:602 length:123 start_codon:yes stop_codon:yes gene_type:complete
MREVRGEKVFTDGKSELFGPLGLDLGIVRVRKKAEIGGKH